MKKRIDRSHFTPKRIICRMLAIIMTLSAVFAAQMTLVNAAPGDEIKYYHSIPSSVQNANNEFDQRRYNLIDYYTGATKNEMISGTQLGDFEEDGSTHSLRRIAANLLNLKFRERYSFKYNTPNDFPYTAESWLASSVYKYAKAGTEVANDNGDYDMVMKEMVSLLYLFKNDKNLLTDNAAYYIINQGLKYYTGNGYGNKTAYSINIGGVGAYYPETENHVLMTLSSYYLTNQWIYNNYRNDPRLRIGEYGNVASFKNSATFENDLLKVISRITYNDFFETNGRAYQAFSLHSLFNLYAFADSPKIVTAAKNALDYFAARYAFQSFEGKRVAPHRRNIKYAGKLSMYENDPTLFMMATLSGAYDWNDTITGNWSTDRQNYFMGDYGQGAGHSLWVAAIADNKLLGQRAYSIPVQIHDFMINKHSGYWARMQARYDESFYQQDIRSSAPDYLYPKYEKATGNIKAAPEHYFVTSKFANVSGGTVNHYCTGDLQHYFPPGEVDSERTTVYDTISRPNMIIPKGHIRDWGSDSTLLRNSLMAQDVMWSSNVEMPYNKDLSDLVSYAKSNNVGTYKNFTYTYNIRNQTYDKIFGFPAAWSQYLYNSSAPVYQRPLSNHSGRNCFMFFDMSKVPGYGYYIVCGWNEVGYILGSVDYGNIESGFQPKNAFWEIVDSSSFARVEDLITYVIGNNPVSWTEPVSADQAKNPPYPKYKYKMTTGETVYMEPCKPATNKGLEVWDDINRKLMVENNPAMISKIEDANGNILPLKDYQADFSNPSAMPLLDVMEVDNSYNFTGVKYAYSTGDGRIQIYNPFLPENNYLCIDSSNPSNPVQFAQNTPWIYTNPSLGTTVKYLNGDTNNDGYEDIIQIFSKNGNLGLKVYENNSRSSFSQSSVLANLGMTQASTIKFLTGDFNGDDKTDIVRVGDNNGKVSLDYIMSGNSGFAVTEKVRDLPFSKTAIDYVAVDANGDGKDDVVQVMNNNELQCRFYFSDGTSCSSSSELTGTSLNGSALRILTGDFDGDGYKDIIKLWDNGGRLAIDCVKMVNYQTMSNPGNGESPSAVDFLMGDVNGDNKWDIIQLKNNNGRLGMVHYKSDGFGGYDKVWSKTDMGQGAGAVRFLTAKINADNKTDIVQIFDGGGKLGVLNYVSNGTGYFVAWGTPDIDGGALSSTDYQTTGCVYDQSKHSLIQVKETNTGNTFKTYFSDGQKFFADVSAPKAVNVFSSATSVGSTIYAGASSVTDTCGVKKVLFATWTTNAGQDDLIWHEGTYIGRDNWNVVINRSEHKNELGEYNIHAYGVDNYGNMGILGAVTVNVLPDTEGPTGSGVTNSGSPTYNSYYKVTVNGVSDPSGVSYVSFPTWTTNAGQDDLVWHEGVYIGNGTWEYVVNKADHKSEKGEYITHVYAWDNAGNARYLGETSVTLR